MQTVALAEVTRTLVASSGAVYITDGQESALVRRNMKLAEFYSPAAPAKLGASDLYVQVPALTQRTYAAVQTHLRDLGFHQGFPEWDDAGSLERSDEARG